VISSYTPSLAALIAGNCEHTSQQFKLLVVSQPSAPNLPHIPGTEEELYLIRQHTHSDQIEVQFGSDATKSRVLEGMAKCEWVHFACHGVQDAKKPNRSGLFLQDGRLELSEIANQSFPNSELAFLSACQTATGDASICEEAVHLAAGMLLTGYRGVVATMWSIPDMHTPQIADKFYAQLLGNSPPNRKDAAKCLTNAIQQICETGVPLAAWVPFIHIGV
jgi:CHAT domain-containing protein